jgi:hypothetical protein
MNKVINKIAADATRLKFHAQCMNVDGTPNESAQPIADEITRLLKRRTIRTMYRDMHLYGDAFLYKQIGTSASETVEIEDIINVNPRYLEPDITGTTLNGWKYTSSGGQTQQLALEEIIHIPREPITGQLYGNSLFEPILQVLNLVLNSQINIAIILDRFALPLLHWTIDSKNDMSKTPMSEILKFLKNLGRMKSGNDVVTDSSIAANPIGLKDSTIDFTPILDKLDQYLFVTAGVPGDILGMPSDNLSAITRKLQTYYDGIFDTQENAADYLIDFLYLPEIMKTVQDPLMMSFSYPKPLVEQESRIATWVDLMINKGVITRKEGRGAMGYSGEPPAQADIAPNDPVLKQGMGAGSTGSSTGQEPNFDKKSGNPKPAIGTGS